MTQTGRCLNVWDRDEICLLWFAYHLTSLFDRSLIDVCLRKESWVDEWKGALNNNTLRSPLFPSPSLPPSLPSLFSLSALFFRSSISLPPVLPSFLLVSFPPDCNPGQEREGGRRKPFPPSLSATHPTSHAPSSSLPACLPCACASGEHSGREAERRGGARGEHRHRHPGGHGGSGHARHHLMLLQRSEVFQRHCP